MTGTSTGSNHELDARAYARRRLLQRFFKRRIVVVALVVALVLMAAALLAQYLAPYDPLQQRLANRIQAPSRRHWLGTDTYGRDVLSRLMYGSRASLYIGLTSVAIAFVAGLLVGTVAGYYRGWFDLISMRLVDVMLSFPTILLAIAIMAVLGSSMRNVIITIAITYFPRFIRVARGAVMGIRQNEYLVSAEAVGASDATIIRRYVIPNSLAPSLVMATVLIGRAILTESALSFLGVGVPPPHPTWGGIMDEGRHVLEIAPWLCLASGVAIMLAVLAFNILGDALRDMLDPRTSKF
jgi:peptide/nickel transport system permease protein